MLICEKNDLITGVLDKAEEINCNVYPINCVARFWILVLSLFVKGNQLNFLFEDMMVLYLNYLENTTLGTLFIGVPLTSLHQG
jgi:hypothetical protein